MPSPLIQQLMGNAGQNWQNQLGSSIDMANQAGANRYAAQQQLALMQHQFNLESEAQKQAALLAEGQGKILDRPVTPGGTMGIKYGMDPATGQISGSMGKTDPGLLNTPFESASDPAALGQQMAQKFNTDAATKATTPQQAAAPTMDHFAALGQAMSGNPFGAAASALQGSKEGDAAFLQNKQDAWPATASYMSQMMRPTGTALEKEQTGLNQRTKMQSDAMLRAKEMEAAQLKAKSVYDMIASGRATPGAIAGTVGAMTDASRIYRLDKLGEPAAGDPIGSLPAEGESTLLGGRPSAMVDAKKSLEKHLLEQSDTYSPDEVSAAVAKLGDPESFLEALRGNKHLQTPYAAQVMMQQMAAKGFAPSDTEKALAEKIGINASQSDDLLKGQPVDYGGLSVSPTGDNSFGLRGKGSGLKVATKAGHYWLQNENPFVNRFTPWFDAMGPGTSEAQRKMREQNQAASAFMEALMGSR